MTQDGDNHVPVTYASSAHVDEAESPASTESMMTHTAAALRAPTTR